MLLGYMPKRDVLEKYDVLQFHELACALKEGNVQKFDEVIQRHETFFIECGIYLIVEKLKTIAYRNLFKRVHERINLHKNPKIINYYWFLLHFGHFRCGLSLKRINWIWIISLLRCNLLAKRKLQWTRHIVSSPIWFMRDASKGTFRISTTNWSSPNRIHFQR